MEMEYRVRELWREVREVSLGSSKRGGVVRVESPPSALEFLREYVSANKPCVVSRSATEHWPAISESLWADDEYLCRTLGESHKVSVHLTPNGRADSLVPQPNSNPNPNPNQSLCFASPCVRSMGLSDALRLIELNDDDDDDDDDGRKSVVAYAQQQNDCFGSEYGGLAKDVESHIPWATEAFGGCLPEAVNLWIGNGRSHTSFHKDHYENIYVVVTGQKHFLLLPPTDVHRLYIRPYPAAQYHYNYNEKEGGGGKCKESQFDLRLEEPSREVPWCSVDPYPRSHKEMERQKKSFPLYFEGPKPFQCTLRAGEMLYLPSMWFHHVTQTPDPNGRTIAINYWYDMQFDIKYAYFNFLQSIHFLSSPSTPPATAASLICFHDDTQHSDISADDDAESQPEMTG